MKENEKLKYFLRYINWDICCLINNILVDSETDPHFSAVTATNLIKCYIELMNHLGENLPFHDVGSYFPFNGFSEEEYAFFENSRRKESEYYVGEQF